MNTKHIVFITGAFVSHHIWDHWKLYFEQKGFTVLVPAWPYKDAPAATLRQTLPHNPDFAALHLQDVIAHYAGVVAALPEKPIVIGHALGGLIVQLLVNNNLVRAGVALHSVPPKGVFSFEWSFVKTLIKPLGLPFGGKIYTMSHRTWNHSFANGVSAAQAAEGYESYCIPECRTVLREALGAAATIDFFKAHPPLLLMTGTEDHMVPESLTYENYQSYHKDNYVTDYKKFSGRSHYVLVQPGWEEVAEYVTDWIGIQGLA
jgi:pimeloyl-ACP methyl ester carboxylesterase